MTVGISFGERIAIAETRLDGHDRDIKDVKGDIDSALDKASSSRKYMHEKIDNVDKRINGLVIGGLIALLGILVNLILTIAVLFLRHKIGG
jgi:hypothetical protein